jgi:hypothetical protein
MTRERLLAAGALLASTACGGEPTAPPDDSHLAVALRIAVGDTVVGSFSPEGFWT